MVQDDEGVGLDGVRVCFDDQRVVSDAGIALVADVGGAAGDLATFLRVFTFGHVSQLDAMPDSRHFCLITKRTDEHALVEAEHRGHAVVKKVIADLKDQAMAHFPSGHHGANTAWTVLAGRVSGLPAAHIAHPPKRQRAPRPLVTDPDQLTRRRRTAAHPISRHPATRSVASG